MIGQSPATTDTQRVPDAPVPQDEGTASTPEPTPARLDPTRYGDWERNGRCIDF